MDYFKDNENCDGVVSLIFDINNNLADATDVYIKISLKETKENFFIEGVKTIFRGDNKKIKFTMKDSDFIDFKVFKNFEDFEIELTFYDSLRLFRKNSFHCHIDHLYQSEDYGGGYTQFTKKLNVNE